MGRMTWRAPPLVPPPPPRCAGCGAPNAPFGIGPPAAAELRYWCGTCNQLQPSTQAAIAERAREAIGAVD